MTTVVRPQKHDKFVDKLMMMSIVQMIALLERGLPYYWVHARNYVPIYKSFYIFHQVIEHVLKDEGKILPERY